MPRRCTICTHPERAAIEKEIVAGTAFREISKRFEIGTPSLHRHKTSHLGEVIERAERQHAVKVERAVAKREEARDSDALDVMAELGNVFARLNKMLDACDTWLTDPDNPDVYNLDPRSHEVKVTYEVVIGETHAGTPITKKQRGLLSELLKRVEDHERGTVVEVQFKHADPRQLLVNTANALRPSIETLAKLLGQLDERPQINVLLTSQWLDLKAVLYAALSRYPDARMAVAQELRAIGANDV